MKIKGCTLFGREKNGKFPHMITLDEEHEELLAELMVKENRDISNEIERALEVHFVQSSTAKRAEMMEEVKRRRV